MVNVEKLKQEIREKAYYLWLNAGKPESDGVEFWLEAENVVETAIETADKKECVNA